MNRRAAPRWIPLLALLPLLALMAADAVMAVLAARTDPGMVADAPRRVGMARLSPTAELRLDASVSQAGRDGYDLVLRLRDAAGAQVPASLAEARLERTTHAASDSSIQAIPRADGSWSARVTLPDAGNWQVTAVARDEEGRSALVVVRLAP
ncbi:FixH family protein [Sabulicella rubraurantiaca]|uniref:FixH family protein n=1 Tax=Sabulicella rubraurantiaca TaxID=2811429 RepID=UPI001A97860A|nr:FixH family protein [Sabulicella rubraurantiaca]